MDPQAQTPQAQPVQVQQQPTLPAKKSPSKMLVLILGCSVLAIGVSGYILGMRNNVSKQAQVAIAPATVQPTPDLTANWPIYSSVQYNYTVKYPSNWAVKDLGRLGNIDSTTVDFVAFNPGEVKDEFSAISIAYTTWTYQQVLEISSTNNVPIIVDGISGTKNYTQDPGGAESINIILPVGLNTFLIHTKKDYEATLNQILSTFTFTDAAQVADAANWKTYTRSEFSLEYPPSWKVFESNDQFNTIAIRSPKPGNSELLITQVPDVTKSEVEKDVSSLFQQDQKILKIQKLQLGSVSGTEYYGCAGVEGCMDGYIVVAENRGKVYKIDFTEFPGEQNTIYQGLISTLKFK